MKKNSVLIFALLTVFGLGVQTASAQFTIPKIPKIKKDQPPQTEKTTAPGSDAGAPEDVKTNPKAPADYNANLNVNDNAIAIDRFGDVEQVKIVGKSGTSYKVVDIKSPNSAVWYSANSVYPFFDDKAFFDIMLAYKQYVAPYLPCYATKHNLAEVSVTDHAFNHPNYRNVQEAKKILQANQPKLAELESLLKSKLGGASSNTFLPYTKNPAIFAEIAAGRAEYMNCAVEEKDIEPNTLLPVFLADIGKAKHEVERYTPGDYLYLVSGGASSEALLRAVSLKAREEWAKGFLKNPSSRAEFDAELNELAAIAAKKLPIYKPAASAFQFRNPAAEKLLMSDFKNTSTLKIFRIGTNTAGWHIQKDNDDLLPSYHYKTVSVYLRDTSDDHPYCHVLSARIKQDYAGGGRYNTEVYSSSSYDELFGCPEK